ncbi:protocatechuate 3,4-dioxygenase subunit alpha [Amycolatopsis sp. WAC 01375]|uniref:protocatechuate 3,4-dioxygenase subunit alpha n=1 Tax=unclassified Amycolatopsis TaxID=2618356 RepID=UPI000F791613|nr:MULTISPECIES: protocatechuate 3,4-dioxygenase subunit alpha [unclassified Amycolatopsis]RSM76305.1 protocatechuate 3,4-dioxygenase subunit alpha [Amycolatopsis sp. WAC 01375]RSN33475.1 protocatechuate 3,4-dioxygenase subunit alpha [Amycolatopsis sp. WAC 01416]
MPETTPSQTVGPYLSIGLPWPDGPDVVPADEPAAIRIHGRVLDGAGEPVPDAMIETWQADADGRFDHPDDPRGAVASGFRGFGRCPTDPGGNYEIRTIMPGPLPGPAGSTQSPHIDVSVLARGLLHRVVTRIYFEDNDNSGDPVLASVPEARQSTLVATKTGDGYRFDIRLQGEGETVFFDV